MNPFFSIILPSYNRASFIKKSLLSVQNQVFEDWELIFVDDGSTDETAKIVANFKEKRFRYFYQQNQERSIARNNGIEKASGKYICFLDSDDEYLPNHLEILHQNILEKNEPTAFFYTGIYKSENQNRTKIPLPKKVLKNPIEHLLTHTIFPTSACLHRDIFKEFQFKPKMSYWEDTALWLQIATKFPLFQINEFTCVWNIHPDSTTQIFENQLSIKKVNQEIKVKKEVLKLNLLAPFLNQKIKNRFFSKIYFFSFYDAWKIKNRRLMFYFFLKYIFANPKVLFQKHTYRAFLDFFSFKPKLN